MLLMAFSTSSLTCSRITAPLVGRTNLHHLQQGPNTAHVLKLHPDAMTDQISMGPVLTDVDRHLLDLCESIHGQLRDLVGNPWQLHDVHHPAAKAGGTIYLKNPVATLPRRTFLRAHGPRCPGGQR